MDVFPDSGQGSDEGGRQGFCRCQGSRRQGIPHLPAEQGGRLGRGVQCKGCSWMGGIYQEEYVRKSSLECYTFSRELLTCQQSKYLKNTINYPNYRALVRVPSQLSARPRVNHGDSY